jgi:hypothetical protein
MSGILGTEREREQTSSEKRNEKRNEKSEVSKDREDGGVIYMWSTSRCVNDKQLKTG